MSPREGCLVDFLAGVSGSFADGSSLAGGSSRADLEWRIMPSHSQGLGGGHLGGGEASQARPRDGQEMDSSLVGSRGISDGC